MLRLRARPQRAMLLKIFTIILAYWARSLLWRSMRQSVLFVVGLAATGVGMASGDTDATLHAARLAVTSIPSPVRRRATACALRATATSAAMVYAVHVLADGAARAHNDGDVAALPHAVSAVPYAAAGALRVGGGLSQQLVTTTSLLPFPFLHATATSTAYGVTVLNADKAGSTAVT